MIKYSPSCSHVSPPSSLVSFLLSRKKGGRWIGYAKFPVDINNSLPHIPVFLGYEINEPIIEQMNRIEKIVWHCCGSEPHYSIFLCSCGIKHYHCNNNNTLTGISQNTSQIFPHRLQDQGMLTFLFIYISISCAISDTHSVKTYLLIFSVYKVHK